MAPLYKRGDVWYFDVRFKGRRIRRAVGHSKKVAELALKDAEVKIAREKFGFSQNDIAIDKFFELFVEYSRAHHRPRSTERYGEVIAHFKSFAREQKQLTFLSEITTEVIDRYIGYRKGTWVNGNGASISSEEYGANHGRKGARTRTINFELDTLRLILNLAIKWGYLSLNPVKGVARLKVDDAKPPRFLTVEECERLFEASPIEQRRIFFTFLSTGMRKSELENLQWQDVDFGRRQILIRSKPDWKPKAGERDIPITEALLATLTEIQKESRKALPTDYVFDVKRSGRSKNWMRMQLIKIAAAAGIADLTRLHTLRHTFASHLVMNGVDLPTVSKLMGHSDVETTMIYAHLAPEHLTKAIGKLPFRKR